MVELWSVKNPITLEERKKIKEGIDMGMSYKELGIYVGRSKSGVLRESKRLGTVNNYDPNKAQEHFEKKQKDSRKSISTTLYKKHKHKTS